MATLSPRTLLFGLPLQLCTQGVPPARPPQEPGTGILPWTCPRRSFSAFTSHINISSSLSPTPLLLPLKVNINEFLRTLIQLRTGSAGIPLRYIFSGNWVKYNIFLYLIYSPDPKFAFNSLFPQRSQGFPFGICLFF